MSQSEMFVSELMIYPIKSVRRVELSTGRVGRRGFEGDRRWMVVNEQGLFVSQRKYPEMALINATIDEQGMTLNAPEMPEIFVSTPEDALHSTTANVWKDDCLSLDAGDDIANWLTQYLKIECRLVYMPEHSERAIDPRYSTNPGNITSFADGFPFLLTTEASLDDLNHRLASAVTMYHFRPNIVLSGAEAYEEDQWQRIRIGEVAFKVAKPCSRCVMTTVNPETGVKSGQDPLLTLSKYRRTELGVIFGQNLIQENLGKIRVGDRVEILE